MGTFIDPLGGICPAQDVIIHYQGMPDTVLPTGSGGGGGGAAGDVNLVSISGAAINIGQDPSVVGQASLPVVLPLGYTLNIAGTVSATLGALVAGTAIIGKVGIDQTTPGTTNAVQSIPGTTGGLTPYHANVPANVTGVVVKNTAGMLYGVQISNHGSTDGYLHLYDSASAPTAGAGTIKKTLIAPGPAGGGGGGLVWSQAIGVTFANGIAYTFTTGITDADNTAPAAAQFSIEMDYK